MQSNRSHAVAPGPILRFALIAACCTAALLIALLAVGSASGPQSAAAQAPPSTAPAVSSPSRVGAVTPATTVPATTVARPTTVEPTAAPTTVGETETDAAASSRRVLDDLDDDQVRRLTNTVEACGGDATRACRWVLDQTGNETLAQTTQWFFAVPLTILIILAVAYVVNRLVRRSINRYLERLNRRQIEASNDDPAKGVRSTLRMATASSTLASAATCVIFVIAGLIILGDLGISLAPLLAGAGIAGIAVGFGAQNMVRDVFAGMLVLIEDQYGVGDVIDAGRATGTVEDFSLRVTKLRDIEGTLWFVPNGVIEDVGNMSQVWSRAILDVEVAYGADHEQAGEIIKGAADRVWEERRPGATIIEEPELWGVERLGESGVAIRIAVKCAPADQWKLSRILRSEIKHDLDAAGIEIPFPQQTLWIRSLEGSNA